MRLQVLRWEAADYLIITVRETKVVSSTKNLQDIDRSNA